MVVYVMERTLHEYKIDLEITKKIVSNLIAGDSETLTLYNQMDSRNDS